jgi:hypothetical protein
MCTVGDREHCCKTPGRFRFRFRVLLPCLLGTSSRHQRCTADQQRARAVSFCQSNRSLSHNIRHNCTALRVASHFCVTVMSPAASRVVAQTQPEVASSNPFQPREGTKICQGSCFSRELKYAEIHHKKVLYACHHALSQAFQKNSAIPGGCVA